MQIGEFGWSKSLKDWQQHKEKNMDRDSWTVKSEKVFDFRSFKIEIYNFSFTNIRHNELRK